MLNHRSHLLKRVLAPVGEPVSLAEAKLYLRVDSTTEDALISDLIIAARMSAESFLKSALITQVWKLTYNDYVDGRVELQMKPVQNVASVVIIARDGGTQTVSSANYYLNASRTKLIFDSQITGFAIDITYNAGYGTAAQIPPPIKYGILAHIAALYDARGLSNELLGQENLPLQVSSLYAPYREVVL
jgi:uncharacterized phiE125 gp8 family phage protein